LILISTVVPLSPRRPGCAEHSDIIRPKRRCSEVLIIRCGRHLADHLS
jgi:hypothetical protein